jgi:hypothetical protein
MFCFAYVLCDEDSIAALLEHFLTKLPTFAENAVQGQREHPIDRVAAPSFSHPGVSSPSASLCEQRRNHVLHCADLRQFLNIYDELYDLVSIR